MSKIKVICNASPIIGLFTIDKVWILWELFDEIVMPTAVYDELCADSVRHLKETEELKRLVSCGKLQICQIQNKELVTTLYGKLQLIIMTSRQRQSGG